jgi:hypothetical protein
LQKKKKETVFQYKKREGEGCGKKERRNTMKRERNTMTRKYKETMWDEKKCTICLWSRLFVPFLN